MSSSGGKKMGAHKIKQGDSKTQKWIRVWDRSVWHGRTWGSLVIGNLQKVKKLGDAMKKTWSGGIKNAKKKKKNLFRTQHADSPASCRTWGQGGHHGDTKAGTQPFTLIHSEGGDSWGSAQNS